MLIKAKSGGSRKAWLDQLGRYALHVTERFWREDFGHMGIQITLDDLKAYTKPQSVNEEVPLLTETELR